MIALVRLAASAIVAFDVLAIRPDIDKNGGYAGIDNRSRGDEAEVSITSSSIPAIVRTHTNPCKQRSSATVPFETAMACRVEHHAAKAVSKSFVTCPVQ